MGAAKDRPPLYQRSIRVTAKQKTIEGGGSETGGGINGIEAVRSSGEAISDIAAFRTPLTVAAFKPCKCEMTCLDEFQGSRWIKSTGRANHN